METFADAVIGSPEAGLTVEQRKRVTIGVELAAKPELLLFLDEPTSGLDSQSAFNIVRFLKKLAAAGQAILCTIHQPNAALFENFDRLLLLKSGGRCVYFGDIGKDACVLREYLKRHGALPNDTDNVAEFMLEAIGAGSSPRIGNRDWADIWLDSPELAQVKDAISQMKEQRKAAGAQRNSDLEMEYASPLWHQIRTVVRRANLAHWRTPNYLFTRLFNHVVIALLTGLTYLNLDDSRQSLQYRVFVAFQATVLPALVISQIEVMYHVKRALFFREQSSKMYSSFVFSTSLIVAEMPYSILCAVCFFLPLYYIPGLQTEASRAGYQFFIILVTEIFSVTMGQALSALTPSLFISSQFDPFIMVTCKSNPGVSFLLGFLSLFPLPPFLFLSSSSFSPFSFSLSLKLSLELGGSPLIPSHRQTQRRTMADISMAVSLFCGVTIPAPQMPAGYRTWLYQLNPFTRLISGMVVTALHDMPVRCAPQELNTFTAPSNMTCGDYMEPFFSRGGAGYLVNNATQDCQYCAYKVGDEFYGPLGLSFDNRWRDLGIYICFIGSSLAILLVAVSPLSYLPSGIMFGTNLLTLCLEPLPQLQQTVKAVANSHSLS